MAGDLLRIGQLAAITGTSADSIRHYERLGLLPPPARTEGGYRFVRIATSNAEALDAVHAFLRYQITEHKTGDPLTLPRNEASTGRRAWLHR
jgi:hypothetical protein